VAVALVPASDSTPTTPCFTLTVQALHADGSANAANVYVGGSTVTSTTGYLMQPGDIFTFPPCTVNAYDLKDIYVNGTSGDGLRFMYSRF
jgi:hypothetical protein